MTIEWVMFLFLVLCFCTVYGVAKMCQRWSRVESFMNWLDKEGE